MLASFETNRARVETFVAPPGPQGNARAVVPPSSAFLEQSGCNALVTPAADGSGIEVETPAALTALRRIATEVGMPLGDLSLAWAIAISALTCTLVGARNAAQLDANVRAAQPTLSPALHAELSQATEEVREKLGPSLDYHQSPADSRSW